MINLNFCSTDQLAEFIRIKMHREILHTQNAEGTLAIIYLSKAGWVCKRFIDPSGIWVKTEYYASYDFSTATEVGYTLTKRNIEYGT